MDGGSGTKQNRVAIYVRVSTDMQADKDSLPMQRKDLTAYSELILKTDQYVIFEDAGYSGKNTERPAYQDMMARIRKREFTHLLVWKIDRISRNLLDFAAMYQELKRLNVTFVSKNEAFDTSTAMGEAMLKIILVFAELERQMTSERVAATMISRAKAGEWNGGYRTYGYSIGEDGQIGIVPEEARCVQLAFDMYDAGSSCGDIAVRLDSEGAETSRGNPWSRNAVRRMLCNPFYTGDYIYNRHDTARGQELRGRDDWVTVTDHHPAIIGREQFDRVQAELTGRVLQRTDGAERSPYRSKNVHVFSGLIRCGQCGSIFYGSAMHRAKSSPYQFRFPRSEYMCSGGPESNRGCRQKGVTDFFVGDFVLNLILNIFYLRDLETPPDAETISRELLFGRSFRDVIAVDPGGIADLRDALMYPSIQDRFRSIGMPQSRPPDTSLLRQRIAKTDRALERLTDLYLYSPDAMTQAEYITKKKSLREERESLEKEVEAAAEENAVPDDAFITMASEFIMAQELSGQRDLRYRKLAEKVDQKVLQDFFRRTVRRITVTGPHVTAVELASGMEFGFEYKKESQPEG